MGWEIGWDTNWQRDIGYGVPAICDHPGCTKKIDRGLGYVCGWGEPYGGGEGCGLFFCIKHGGGTICQSCSEWDPFNDMTPTVDPFQAKPDILEWVQHKLHDESWAQWRTENPDETKLLREAFASLIAEIHRRREKPKVPGTGAYRNRPLYQGRTPKQRRRRVSGHAQLLNSGWRKREAKRQSRLDLAVNEKQLAGEILGERYAWRWL